MKALPAKRSGRVSIFLVPGIASLPQILKPEVPRISLRALKTPVVCPQSTLNGNGVVQPVITYAGPLLAMLLTGSFVIETMFSIPGIGAEFVTSVSNRDYTMIMALTVMYGAMIIVANVITDIITAAVDPRIRLK